MAPGRDTDYLITHINLLTLDLGTRAFVVLGRPCFEYYGFYGTNPSIHSSREQFVGLVW